MIRSDNIRGILWMFLAAAALVVMSAVIKHIRQDLPFGVVLFFRMFFALCLYLPIVARGSLASLATKRLKGHIMRSLVGVMSMGSFVFALAYLPLADFIALSFTRPLWMPVLAWLMLRERVGPYRLAFALTGFVGVLVVARPSMDVSPAYAVAVVGGALTAITLIQVKQLATTEPAHRIVFYFSAVGSAVSLPMALYDWVTPTPAQLGWAFVAAVAAAVVQFSIARATRVGEATVLAPADFVQLPLALLLGFILFSEVPDRWTYTGIAIIVASIAAIMRREAMLGRTASTVPPPGTPPPPPT